MGDLNSRPPRPERGALAKLRYSPYCELTPSEPNGDPRTMTGLREDTSRVRHSALRAMLLHATCGPHELLARLGADAASRPA